MVGMEDLGSVVEARKSPNMLQMLQMLKLWRTL